MLKLEKASRDRQISILFRNKDYFFTHSLFIAFAIAAGFHLLFLLIFQIAPFKLKWGETVFPPVEVEADATSKDFAVVADPQQQQLVSNAIPSKKPSMPMLQEQPTILAAHHMEHIKEKNSHDNPFTPIEEKIYLPTFEPVIRPALPPISVIVSGPLAEKKLLPIDFPPLNISSTSSDKEIRISYEVLLDEKSGKICWFEPKEPSHDGALNRFAEELLKGLVFAKETSAFLTEGTVEWQFNYD